MHESHEKDKTAAKVDRDWPPAAFAAGQSPIRTERGLWIIHVATEGVKNPVSVLGWKD